MNLVTLIDEIAAVTLPDVFNPWRDTDPSDVGDGPGNRRVRLAKHFNCEPKFLLVGEAPGYQGCHTSGVAFTSERLLCEGKIPRIPMTMRLTTRPKPWSEPSATVVWGTLHELGIAETTVLWNAFAWHPHEPGDLHSNRTPTRQELLAGAEICTKVCTHFRTANVVAIGKQAQHLLTWLGIKHIGAVRHPSMGGANQFRSGMAKIARVG